MTLPSVSWLQARGGGKEGKKQGSGASDKAGEGSGAPVRSGPSPPPRPPGGAGHLRSWNKWAASSCSEWEVTCFASHGEESLVLCLEVGRGVARESKVWGEGSVGVSAPGKFLTGVLERVLRVDARQLIPLQVDQCGWEGAELKESSLQAEGAGHGVRPGDGAAGLVGGRGQFREAGLEALAR